MLVAHLPAAVFGGPFVLLALGLYRLWAAGDYAFLVDGPLFLPSPSNWYGYVLLGSEDAVTLTESTSASRPTGAIQPKGKTASAPASTALLRAVVDDTMPRPSTALGRLLASLADAWSRRPRDVSMVIGTAALFLLLVLWALALSMTLEPALLGWSLATFICEALLIAAGRTAAYYRPDHSDMPHACLGLLLCLHALYCAAIYLVVLDAHDGPIYSSGPFQLLLLWALALPSAAGLAYAVPAWEDMPADYSSLSRGLAIALAATLSVVLLFIGLLGLLFSRPLALAFFATLVLALTLAAAALSWRSEGYISRRWRLVVTGAFGVVMAVGGAIGAFSEGGAAYAGFSLCALTLAASFVALGLSGLSPLPGEAWRSYHWPVLLPSYALVDRRLVRADTGVESFAAAALILVCWAVYTMLTLRPRLIGATAGAVVQSVGMHAALHALVSPLQELGGLHHVLTPQMLAAARSEAEAARHGAYEQICQSAAAAGGAVAATTPETQAQAQANGGGQSPGTGAGAGGGRRRQAAFNLSDQSISHESTRVQQALARLQSAEAALMAADGVERRARALALPALDELLATEQEASAALSAHVHGLLLLNGGAALASKHGELQGYVQHATGARVSAAELDELVRRVWPVQPVPSCPCLSP